MNIFKKYSPDDMGKIRKYEYKHGINYVRPGDKAYKITLFFAFLCWLFMTAMVSFYVIGYLLGIRDGVYAWDSYFITMFVVYIITVLTPITYITVSIVSHYVEKFAHTAALIKIITFAVNIITIPILFVQFAMISKIDGIPLSSERITEYDPGYFGLHKFFYWRHALPMLAVSIMFAVLIYLYVRERIYLYRTHEKIMVNEQQHKIITDEE